jgi:methionine biosynthesis protein MetW
MSMLGEFYERYWSEGIDNWSPLNLRVSEEQRDLLAAYIRPGDRVLDIGCGDGRVARALKATGISYTGVDISHEGLRRCAAEGFAVIQHDIQQPLPLEDGQFDVVTVFEVLEHLFRPDEGLRQIRRVLRPGGVVLGSVPNTACLANRLLMLAGLFNPGGSPATSLKAPWRDPHIRFLTHSSLARLIAETGYADSRITGERFSLTDLPVLYRLNGRTRRLLQAASRPLGFAGRGWPGLFASHMFFAAQKRTVAPAAV